VGRLRRCILTTNPGWILSNPWTAWLDAATLCVEAQSVIALRMIRFSGGGAVAASEAQRMVLEKVVANVQAQFGAGMAIAGMAMAAGRGSQGARRAAAKPYRQAVRANRRRLTRRR
jgi:hypothetical protein